MRKLLIMIFLTVLLALPVRALEIEAPSVPESASDMMPDLDQGFGEGIGQILRKGLMKVRPDLREACGICMGVLAAVLIVSILRTFPGAAEKASDIVGCIAISGLLLGSAGALIDLGAETVTQLSEYGKLLLPVMTSALAAQGGAASSVTLYTGTAFFNTLLTQLISNILTPMIYLFLAICAGCAAIGEDLLKKLKDTIKWLMTWVLKILLYIFTGYIGITGVVSGTTDAAALKAAKIAISGVVPVVGGILSDASEAVLVSAGTVKNAAGIYGLLAIAAIWIGPFLKIGVHYLLLKLTSAVCSVFGSKRTTDLVQDFSSAMGMLLGMTGAVCSMLMISMVCFLKGVG